MIVDLTNRISSAKFSNAVRILDPDTFLIIRAGVAGARIIALAARAAVGAGLVAVLAHASTQSPGAGSQAPGPGARWPGHRRAVH